MTHVRERAQAGRRGPLLAGVWRHAPLLLLPALCVGGFEHVRHSLLTGMPTWVGNLVAAAFGLIGSLAYYLWIFRLVEQANADRHARQAREAVEAERDRIAAELHDSLAQTLFFANVQLQRIGKACRRRQAEPDIEALLTELRQAIEAAYADVRQAIADLNATRSGGEALLPSIRQRVAEFRRQTGLHVSLSLPARLDLPAPLSEPIVHALQEGLWNVRKHAEAHEVSVSLEATGEAVTLTVADDGTGFDPAHVPTGFGLSRLREEAARRGGTFTVRSSRGRGTVLRLSLPYAAHAVASHGTAGAGGRADTGTCRR